MSSSNPRQSSALGSIVGPTTAFIAVVCLFVQLAASAVCGGGSASASPEHGRFPICHAHAGDADLQPARDGGHEPLDRHSCPFCSVHCHQAAVALASSVASVVPIRITATVVDPPTIRRYLSARFAIGAPPRGPPSRA